MEKFFKVAEGAKPYADYDLWMNENKKVNKVVCEFLDKHGIEARQYFYSKDGISGEAAKQGDEKQFWFGIVPAGEDLERFKRHLNKPRDGNRYYFKKGSTLYKEFAQMAIENQLRSIRKPSAGGIDGYYDCNWCSSKTRLFLHDGVLYGSIECENLGAPKVNGIIEIPGSEFYKVLEAVETMKKEREIDR